MHIGCEIAATDLLKSRRLSPYSTKSALIGACAVIMLNTIVAFVLLKNLILIIIINIVSNTILKL